MWVLGTTPGSSARASCALKCYVTSPAPIRGTFTPPPPPNKKKFSHTANGTNLKSIICMFTIKIKYKNWAILLHTPKNKVFILLSGFIKNSLKYPPREGSSIEKTKLRTTSEKEREAETQCSVFNQDPLQMHYRHVLISKCRARGLLIVTGFQRATGRQWGEMQAAFCSKQQAVLGRWQ